MYRVEDFRLLTGQGRFTDDVVPAGHRLPPVQLYFEFEVGTQWPIVPARVESAIDFAALKEKAAPLAERN